MNFRVFDTPAAVTESAADWLVRAVAASPGRLVLSLSGGSTPRALYEILGTGSRRDILAARDIVWVTGDERCVPPGHPQLNAEMIRDTLFAEGIPARHRFLSFRTELQEPETIAAAFEQDWREAGVELLDIALLGIGEDGHTASLFPGTAILEIRDRVAAPVFVERLGSWRVSLTVPVLRAAQSRVVLAVGGGKREAIERARKGEHLPVTRVCGAEPECWWFVDRAAYGQGG